MEGEGTREKRVWCTRKNQACTDCTKKCLRIHKKSQSVSDTSSFFKVMLGDFTQFMYIPPAFAQIMTDLAGANIFLEDSSGARWRVLVFMKRRSLAFGRGWCDFILDHSIEAGEFLVFRKVGQSIFSVQIFSTSGCEKVTFCETKKINQNQRKRTLNVIPNTRRPKESTKNGYIPTIQEATRREERRARRTNAVIRRLIMEDFSDEDLLVKEQLPLIPPIATMPSDGPLSLCSSQNGESLNMNVATCPSLVENLDRPEDLDMMCTGRNAETNSTERNSIKRGKCEPCITTNKKHKYEAKIIGEDQNFILENNSVHDAASETQTDIQLSVPMEDKFTISARENGNGLFSVKTENVDFTEAPELKSETLTISASVTSQSWLELPERLPFTIGKNRMGRKVVILRDPSMRLWPVLYYETSKFVRFIDGWEEFKRANDICAGETCEFELYSASDEVLQVRITK